MTTFIFDECFKTEKKIQTKYSKYEWVNKLNNKFQFLN